ncbi:MAG: TadE family protein [Candidatus Nanopelagicales bacterium]
MTAEPRPPHPPAAEPRLAGERGSASLELAVVFPVVMALILLIVQAGIYWHARTLALTAAQEGLRSASVLRGSSQAGVAHAADFLDRAGADGWLTDRRAAADRGSTSVTVTVTGRAISLVPGIAGLPVRQAATGPVERPTAP